MLKHPYISIFCRLTIICHCVTGARHAMYFADRAIIVTNSELSSCRDSDKMIGFISSKSKRAEDGKQPVSQALLVTRFGEQYSQLRAWKFPLVTVGFWRSEEHTS